MSPRHPLARDPNGSNLAFWAGIILVLTLIYSIRFTPPQAGRTQSIPAVLPMPQGAVAPPPLPANAPIPRTEERLPVVTPDEKPPVVSPTELSGAGAAIARTVPAWWQVATPLPPVNAVLVAPDGLVWAGDRKSVV